MIAPVRVWHPPAGDGWWGDATLLICTDGPDVWGFGPAGSWRLPDTPVCRAFVRDGVALLERPDGRRLRVRDGQATPVGPGGLDAAIGWERTGWTAVPPLPCGARTAADLRAAPTGAAVTWRDGDFLVCRTAKGVRVVAAGVDRWRHAGEGWHLLGDGEAWDRIAAFGRSPRRLPEPLVDGVVRDGILHGTRPGAPPVAWSLPDLVPVEKTHPVLGALAARGWTPGFTVIACDGRRLAGPGGLTDLATGTRLPVPLPTEGAAVFVGADLWTTAWPSGDGARIDAAGRTRGRFHLPLRGDDPLVHARIEADAPVFVTASGRAWQVTADGPRRLPREIPPTPPGGPFELDAVAETCVGRLGWRSDGLVVHLDGPGADQAGASSASFRP